MKLEVSSFTYFKVFIIIIDDFDQDAYKLKTGAEGNGGFELIGSDKEISPLLLRDLLSYDEMQISALIGVSTRTFFINDGSRESLIYSFFSFFLVCNFVFMTCYNRARSRHYDAS